MEKPSLDFTDFDVTLSFPFLCEQETMRLITDSKVMFIMRGLPGSGKSTIVRSITSAYPSSVVCSADDYFLQNGVYKFDPSGLKYAHSACQNKTRDSCESGVGVVIVDNTNVRRWEMRFYLDLAKKTDYVVILVEPKTAWKWKPVELAARNKHSVDADTLQRKVDQFDDFIPVYYAWFLNDHSSRRLAFIVECLLRELVQLFPDFTDILLKQLHLSPAEYRHRQQSSGGASAETDSFSAVFGNYYTRGSRTGNILHCTAKFCGGGKAVGAKAFHSKPCVQNALGQAFSLEITSICFSPRTVGARVQLKDSQFVLFDKPEEKDWNGMQPRVSPAKSPHGATASAQEREKSPGTRKSSQNEKKRSKNAMKKAAKYKQEKSVPDEDQVCSHVARRIEPKSTKPVAKAHGRSAHVTVGCAQGFESRETNFDVLRLCDMEETCPAADADFVPVTGGKARYFGDGVCCVYFNPSLHVKTIYSGFY